MGQILHGTVLDYALSQEKIQNAEENIATLCRLHFKRR